MKPKPDPGTEIDSEKYFNAQAHWVSYWASQGMEVPSFGKFLGLSGGPVLHTRKPNKRYILKMRASAVKKVEKLASPYWYTILKAYQIRKQRYDKYRPWK